MQEILHLLLVVGKKKIFACVWDASKAEKWLLLRVRSQNAGHNCLEVDTFSVYGPVSAPRISKFVKEILV